MRVSFAAPDLPTSGAVVVGVLEDRVFTPSARRLDEQLEGCLRRAMEASRFRGKRDQTLVVLAPGRSLLSRVLLLGCGKASDLDALACQNLGGTVYAALAGQVQDAVLMVDAIDDSPLAPAAAAAEMALGAVLRSYRFARYFTKETEDDKPQLGGLAFACDGAEQAQSLFEPKRAVADAVSFARDLVSEPANVIYPETLAEKARTLAELGVDVDVLDVTDMKALGMGSLLGVGQGSDHPSRLVVMAWWGAGRPEAGDVLPGAREGDDVDPDGPLAFIGKGVTFDTGGISIKPAAGMEDMKWDMAGSAAVIGLLRALALRKAKVNAIGAVGLVENMPSGKAQRPGDVVTSMSGQTIEVINTDAEGRLVLADVLWYVKQRFRPRLMIDLATLTGAIIIALGHEKAGMFATDDTLALRLETAGKAVGEPVWRMPLGDEYDKLIKSDIADMKNVGDRSAGSISAAQFLKRFVGKVPWVHLDIAGVAWSKKDRPVVPKGASAFGVRLLDRFVADHYELP